MNISVIKINNWDGVHIIVPSSDGPEIAGHINCMQIVWCGLSWCISTFLFNTFWFELDIHIDDMANTNQKKAACMHPRIQCSPPFKEFFIPYFAARYWLMLKTRTDTKPNTSNPSSNLPTFPIHIYELYKKHLLRHANERCPDTKHTIPTSTGAAKWTTIHNYTYSIHISK